MQDKMRFANIRNESEEMPSFCRLLVHPWENEIKNSTPLVAQTRF